MELRESFVETVESAFPVLARIRKSATKEDARTSDHKPLPALMISVVIPAHNEERYLESTLDALQRQNYGWREIIVVANGCTDNTPEVARGKCDRLIVMSQKSLGVARNLGARMARGDVLMFLDADTLLDPGALRKVAQEFTREYAAGTVKGQPDEDRPDFKILYGLKNTVHRLSLHPGSSGVILCWRDHFMQAGGFDEGLEVRENSELMKRLLRFGKYAYLERVVATTSMRRYAQRGCLHMTLLWIRLWLQSLFGDLHNRTYEIVR